MTHEQTTSASVEVTQADRELYIELMERAGKLRADLYAGDIRAGKWDQDDCMAIIARHRIAHSAPAGDECPNPNGCGYCAEHGCPRATAGEVEPVAWLVRHEMHGTEVTTLKCTEADKAYGWTETPLHTHPAPPADLVELVGHWRFLNQMIEDRIVETDQPDRVMWHGVWYDGPLATAYLETLRAIQKLARAALAKHGGA